MTLNSSENQYLVVWYGDDNTGALVEDEQEIYGQRLDGTDGTEIGGDFRISDMGPDGDRFFDAFLPAVAYSPLANEILVIWHGSGDDPVTFGGKRDIYGQRLAAASGIELGFNDFPISEMGSDLTYDAFEAAVTFNSTDNEYLVVWRGDDNTGGLIDGEFEIFGQRIDAATGAELGVDFRISAMGPDMDADYDAFSPAAAYNPTNNQYLVVWRGDDTAGNLIDEEFEIFGQRLEGDTGVPIGGPFRISTMGTDGEADFGPFNPAVAYNGTDNEYMVAWNADDNSGSLVDGEAEIFGQRLDAATGMPIGDLVRLSAMGPDGDPRYAALDPAAAYNSLAGEVLVVWRGDDDRGALVDDEYEIFGQRYKSLVEIHLPIIRRDN